MLIEVFVPHQMEVLLPGRRAHVGALMVEPVAVEIRDGADLKPGIVALEPRGSRSHTYHALPDGTLYRPLRMPVNKDAPRVTTRYGGKAGLAEVNERDAASMLFGTWNWQRLNAKEIRLAFEQAPDNPFVHPAIYASPAPTALVHRDATIRGSFHGGGVTRDEATAYARAAAASLRFLDGQLMVPTGGPQLHLSPGRHWRVAPVRVFQSGVLDGRAERHPRPSEDYDGSTDEGLIFGAGEQREALATARALMVLRGSGSADAKAEIEGRLTAAGDTVLPRYVPSMRRAVLQAAEKFAGWTGIWAMPGEIAIQLMDLLRVAEDIGTPQAELVERATRLVALGALPVSGVPVFREGHGRRMNGQAWDASGKDGSINIRLALARVTGRLPELIKEMKGENPTPVQAEAA